MSLARMLLGYIFSPIVDGAQSVAQGTKEVTTSTYQKLTNLVTTSDQERMQQRIERYNAVADPIRARHASRKALIAASTTSVSTAEIEKFELIKTIIQGVVDTLLSEIVKLNEAFFSFANRNEVRTKSTQRSVLAALLEASSFPEMQLCADQGLLELNEGNHNTPIGELLLEICEAEKIENISYSVLNAYRPS